MIELAELIIEKENSEDEDRIGYSEVNYPNTKILRETFTKVIFTKMAILIMALQSIIQFC